MTGSLEERWSSHFRRVLLSHAHHHRGFFGKNCCNTFGLVALALKELQSTDLICIGLDKGPGYVLVDAATFSSMESLAMNSKYYIPMPLEYLNVESILRSYTNLAKQIGVYHDDLQVPGQKRVSGRPHACLTEG